MVNIKCFYPATGLEKLCKLFGKSRQAFYDHSLRKNVKQISEALIIDRVKQIRLLMPRIGCIKLHGMLKKELAEHNIMIGRDSFFELLGRYDLQIKRRKKYVRTTDSNHMFHKWADLTISLHTDAPEQLWVSDITYLRTINGFIYLSLITDGYSRKIIGYHLSQHLKTQGCLIALGKAIASLGSEDYQLIHHSDRGIQYCCNGYVDMLQRHKIKISMTQNGSPYENAIAERVNGILKSEQGLDQIFVSYHQAIGQTHLAINTYNNIRPHMSCGYLTPSQAHMESGKLKNVWKIKNKM